MIVQMKDDGEKKKKKDDGGQESGERWTDSKYILEIEWTGLAMVYILDLCESRLCPQLRVEMGCF